MPVTDAMLALGLMVIEADWLTVPPHPPLTVYIMLALPAVTPVTTPDASTVATAVLSLLHAPLPLFNTTELAVYVVLPPIHTDDEPVTEAMLAFGLIVIACWADTVPPQPPLMVYIMLALPADTPVTTPDELTVANAVLPLLHAPVPPLNTTVLAE